MSDTQVTPETEAQAEVIETTPVEAPKGDRRDSAPKGDRKIILVVTEIAVVFVRRQKNSKKRCLK